MSSHAQPARGKGRGPGKPRTPEPVTHADQEQLEALGWKLFENIDDPEKPGRPYQMVNKKMRWRTDLYATAQLAVAAARTIQKNSKQKGAAVAEPDADERFERGAVPPAAERYAVTRQFQSPLGVALSAEQINAKLDEFKEASDNLATLEGRFEEVKKTFKADIEKAEAEKRDIERVLIRRADEQEVACEERLYDSAKLVCVVRLDTNVIVESRPMRPEEAQQSLLKL